MPLKFMLILFVTFMFSCTKKNTEAPASAAKSEKLVSEKLTMAPTEKAEDPKSQIGIDQVLNYYPRSDISRRGPFELVFSEAVGKADTSADRVVHFSPSIDAEIRWISETVVRITPEKMFPSAQKYQVTLNLQKLDKPLYSVNQLHLDIKVRKPGAEIKVDDFEFKGSKLILPGILNLADYVDQMTIEKMLVAEQEGTKLNVIWSHGIDGRRSHFRVQGITRKDFATEVRLNWSLKQIGLSQDAVRAILVEPFKSFIVSGIRAEDSTNKNLIVTFNDPVDAKQNFTGMIRLGSQKFTTEIDNNKLKIYLRKTPPNSFSLHILAGIRSVTGEKLKTPVIKDFKLKGLKPGVRFVGKATIMPDGDNVSIPFEAVNVHSVQVTAFKIDKSKLHQFLQVNGLSEHSQLGRVGRYLWRKTISLQTGEGGLKNWKRFHIDASELLKQDRNSLYRLTLTINRGNSTYQCPESTVDVAKEKPFKSLNQPGEYESSNWDYVQNYYTAGTARWTQRNNPCTDPYYLANGDGRTTSSKNILRTNLALIIQQGSGSKYSVAVTDIKTAMPAAGVLVTMHSYQGQSLFEGITDKNGMLEAQTDNPVFVIKAIKEEDETIIRLTKGSALSMSHFDVGGERVENGIKGRLYFERGVWRPGDKIHAVFSLHDPENLIPAAHPISVDLIDPKGRVIQTQSPSSRVAGLSYFTLNTDEKSPTGRYRAVVKLGDRQFSSSLTIEMVKPNRLKVELSFKDEILKTGAQMASIFSQWLHGGSAVGLTTQVELKYSNKKPSFSKYSDYHFVDLARQLESENVQVYKGILNEKGLADFSLSLPSNLRPPGMLNARFTSRVFENSGDFSVEKSSYAFHPYAAYVGVRAPKGDASRNMLLTDIEHDLDLVTVNNLGEPISDVKVEVSFHKISWRWWWEKTKESYANFASNSSQQSISKKVVISKNGEAKFKFQIKYPDWGRYLLRACDLSGGHCSSQVVFIDWPGWAGRAAGKNSDGASRLNFASDKKKYNVGEEATVFLPKTQKGQALVSIMRGDTILQRNWIKMNGEAKQFQFKMTGKMTPNIYVGVTMIQPHHDRKSDAPIRLYGVIPITVEDPETILEPNIELPLSVKPQKPFDIVISETNNQAMAYTVAVVDEGLLGLTKFRSKDLHKSIYAKESLSVQTWDFFDKVFGAYAAQLERLISLGGDGDESGQEEGQKKRRFDPVVQFLGPFMLDAGKTATHQIKLPNYIGAVRVMVNASYQGKYGKIEKEVKVKDDLMVLPTLPRVLGSGDQLDIPVTVFSLKDSVKKVTVAVNSSSNIKFADGKTQDLFFDKPGEKIAFFPVYIGDHPGKSRLEFSALNDTSKASSEVHIDIRAPNPADVRSETVMIAANEQHRFEFETFGIEGTNEAIFEATLVEPLELEKHYRALIQFPHGCAEQTTSKAFPQLVLGELTDLSPEQKEEIKKHTLAAIEKIKNFQTSNGGIGYWPGASRTSDWITSYVLHYLLTARDMGYSVPESLFNSMVGYQRESANMFRSTNIADSQVQAYRLYTLARAGYADIGAMSRLKELKRSAVASWLLALALKRSGFAEDATRIIGETSFEFREYVEGEGSFGSSLRDIGIALYSTSQISPEQSNRLYQELSKRVNKTKYINTHGISFALLGAAKYFQSQKLEMSSDASSQTRFSYQIDKGANGSVSSELPIARLQQSVSKGRHVALVTNPLSRPLYVTRSISGVPESGKERSFSRGLALNVSYLDAVSKKPIEIRSINRGQEVVARVQIKNKTSQKMANVAMEYMVAAGFEIFDGRVNAEKIKNLDYQDVRDDRIYSYFSVDAGESKEFRFRLQASHRGRFYMPATRVNSMYNKNLAAQMQGQWIKVQN